jgi:hypothetical protein
VRYKTFLPRFHHLIRAKIKDTTIRERAGLIVGERFALRYWTGKAYRSPMGWLGTAHCLCIVPIRLFDGDVVTVDGTSISQAHLLDNLAIRDGFRDWSEMREHFADRLPFVGEHTAWTDFRPGKPT